MLELPWYPEVRSQAQAPKPNASPSDGPQAHGPQGGAAPKKADEQFRSAVRGALQNLVSNHGAVLTDAVVLPCNHVCDRYDATSLYKQKLARQKMADKPNQDPTRVEQLKASAQKTYVCIRCPVEERHDIGVKPEQLASEPRINGFMNALRRDIPGHIDRASAEDLELLKTDLRKAGAGIPKLPTAAPNRTPEQAAYNCAVGESLARQGQFAEAETWFRAAVEAEPEHRSYNHNMAVCLTKQNKKAQAAPFMKKANAAQPESQQSATQKGYDLLARGKYAEAEPIFRQALSREPLSSSLHALVGGCASGMGRHAEAFAHFNKALSMRPNHPKYQRDVGYSLYMQGKYGEALSYLAAALIGDPGNARFSYELAWCHRKLGHTDKAEYFLRDAVDADRGNAHYNNDLGMMYFIQKRYFDARPLFKDAATADKDNETFSENLAKCDAKIEKKTTPLLNLLKSKIDRFLEE